MIDLRGMGQNSTEFSPCFHLPGQAILGLPYFDPQPFDLIQSRGYEGVPRASFRGAGADPIEGLGRACLLPGGG